MKEEVIGNLIWGRVPDKNSIQKKALKKAIKKSGNYTELAKKMGIHKQSIYRWLKKKCKDGENLMHPDSAKLMEKSVKINGLAGELCPEAKKSGKL